MKESQNPEIHLGNVSEVSSHDQLNSMSDENFAQSMMDTESLWNKVYYEPNPCFISRTIVGETVLVPTGEMTKQFNGMITFSPTGQFIWQKLLEGKKTKADLAKLLFDHYECTLEEAKNDVTYFIDKCLSRNVVIKVKL